MGEIDRTDAVGDGDEGAAPPIGAELDKLLASLKRPRGDADDDDVTSEQARLTWSSVTETEPEAAPDASSTSESSFKFDLGSALARLGGEEPPAPASEVEPGIDNQSDADADEADAVESQAAATTADLPTRQRAVDPVSELPTRQPAADPASDLPTRQPAVDPVSDLPTRRPTVEPSPGTLPPSMLPRRGATDPQASTAAEQRELASEQLTDTTSPGGSGDVGAIADPSDPSSRSSGGSRSVFDSATPAPALPASPQRMPSVEPKPPVIPPGALSNLPTLPPATPATAPMIAEPVTHGPTTPDIHAVRSFQLRAERDQRRRKVVGRTMLVVLLLGAAVTVALFFGRSYLYPTEWDPALTPIVDQIQEANGEEFTEELPLETLENPEYAAIVLELAVGDTWADRLPEWRALGVASGAADSAAVSDAVVAWRPAVYDPVTETIYQAATADPAAVTTALDAALAEVFATQHGTPPNDEFPPADPGVVGVSSLEEINSRAIDRALLVGANATATGAATQAGPLAPLPLLYEFLAIDGLGAPLVEAAGSAAGEWGYGDVYPPAVLESTDVPRDLATPGQVPVDTQSLADPVALGADNWSLIWASRLPRATVERLATIVVADSYRPVARGGTRCFVADLETTSESNADEVLGAMARWLAAGPPSAAGTSAITSPNMVEVFACDPGADAQVPIDPSAVASLLSRQAERL